MPNASLTSAGRILLAFVLAISVAGALFFGTRTALRVIYWADPAHQQQPLEAWMTIGYVARSYHVDRRALGQELGLSRPDGRPKTLKQHARDRNQTLDAFFADVDKALATLGHSE